MLANYRGSIHLVSGDLAWSRDFHMTLCPFHMTLCHKEFHRSLDSVLAQTDVLYMTRVQKERFISEEEYEKVCV